MNSNENNQEYELTELQKQIVASMQGNVPMSKEPYRDIADSLGISEDQLLEELQLLREQGFLRRVGAILRHREAGYNANAMVAWQVPEDHVDQVGELLSEFTAASHVYQRPTYPDWPYNLFTMIHAASEEECHKIASEMSKTAGVTEYKLLFSTKEYKKTSMTYF